MGLLNAVTVEQEASVVVLLLTGLVVLLYFVLSLKVRGKTLQHIVKSDQKLYLSNPKKYHDELINVFSTTPQVSNQIAATGAASMLLAVTLLWQFVPQSFEYYTISVAIVLMGLGVVAYMFSLEQLTTTISPSIVEAERFRLYSEASTLKALGFFGMWSSVLVMLTLSNVYAVTAACFFTLVVIVRHYEARWVRPHERELMYME